METTTRSPESLQRLNDEERKLLLKPEVYARLARNSSLGKPLKM